MNGLGILESIIIGMFVIAYFTWSNKRAASAKKHKEGTKP